VDRAQAILVVLVLVVRVNMAMVINNVVSMIMANRVAFQIDWVMMNRANPDYPFHKITNLLRVSVLLANPRLQQGLKAHQGNHQLASRANKAIRQCHTIIRHISNPTLTLLTPTRRIAKRICPSTHLSTPIKLQLDLVRPRRRLAKDQVLRRLIIPPLRKATYITVKVGLKTRPLATSTTRVQGISVQLTTRNPHRITNNSSRCMVLRLDKAYRVSLVSSKALAARVLVAQVASSDLEPVQKHHTSRMGPLEELLIRAGLVLMSKPVNKAAEVVCNRHSSRRVVLGHSIPEAGSVVEQAVHSRASNKARPIPRAAIKANFTLTQGTKVIGSELSLQLVP